MATIDVKVEGIVDTNKNILKQHDKIAEKIRKPVLKFSQQIVNEYREYTPVGHFKPYEDKNGRLHSPGNLKKSIAQKMIKATRNGSFVSGTARSIIARTRKNGYHRHLVAYGTGARYTKKGAYRGRMPANREFASVSEKVDSLPFDLEIMKLLEEDEYL